LQREEEAREKSGADEKAEVQAQRMQARLTMGSQSERSHTHLCRTRMQPPSMTIGLTCGGMLRGLILAGLWAVNHSWVPYCPN